MFTYELASRNPDCLFGFGACVGDMLASVTAPDARTVEFRLKRRDATFLTLVLPQVTIDSRAVVEAAYAPLAERAPTLDAAAYRSAVDRIFEQLGAEEPDCPGALEGTDELLEAAAIEPLPRDQFIQADGQFDACLYADYTARLLQAAGGQPRGDGARRHLARLPHVVVQSGADRHRALPVRPRRGRRPRAVRGVRRVPPRSTGDTADRAEDPPRPGGRPRAARLARAAMADRAPLRT